MTEVTELIGDDDDDGYDDGDASTWGTAGGVSVTSSNATSAPVVEEEETTTVKPLSVCDQVKCGANKVCIADPGFRMGFRCCRKIPCNYG